MGASTGMAAVLRNLRPVEARTALVGGDPAECARVLGVDGVAVSLAPGKQLGELVWATPGVSTRLEDLQFTIGHGPGPDVVASGASVLEPDLSRLSADRWPALLPEAMALGVRAVFCLPLSIGGACLGTMTLQRSEPGPLPVTFMSDALILAGALTSVIIDRGDHREAFAAAAPSSDLYRAVVHQASGMISVQAGIPLAEALLLLRAHAFGHGRPVVEVAEDVVARRVHFGADRDGPDVSGGRGR